MFHRAVYSSSDGFTRVAVAPGCEAEQDTIPLLPTPTSRAASTEDRASSIVVNEQAKACIRRVSSLDKRLIPFNCA